MAAATTMAALPSAGGARPRNLVATGTALVCAGATTAFGALMAAYIEFRSHTQPWPPKGVKIDEYLGNMLIITMLLGSLCALWAVSAVKRDERRQASAAFIIAIGFGVAFINLLSYSLSKQHLALSQNAYAGVAGAMTGLLGLLVGLAVAFLLLTVLRIRGEHVTAANPDLARAAMWFWHYTTAATAVVWFTVVVLK